VNSLRRADVVRHLIYTSQMNLDHIVTPLVEAFEDYEVVIDPRNSIHAAGLDR